MRIHELAKELGVSSKEMLETLEKMGVTGKSASSSVPEDLVPRLRASGGKATKAAKPRQVMEPPPKPRAKPKPKKTTPTAVPALAVEEAAPAEDAAAGPAAGAPAPATTTTAVPPAPTTAAPATSLRVRLLRLRLPHRAHPSARCCKWFGVPPHSSSPRRPIGPRPTS
jgi:translation initiation factor IF-2